MLETLTYLELLCCCIKKKKKKRCNWETASVDNDKMQPNPKGQILLILIATWSLWKEEGEKTVHVKWEGVWEWGCANKWCLPDFKVWIKQEDFNLVISPYDSLRQTGLGLILNELSSYCCHGSPYGNASNIKASIIIKCHYSQANLKFNILSSFLEMQSKFCTSS